MPKVVHLTSVHAPFDIRIFLKECRSLVQHGYEVVLVAPHDRDEVVDGVQIRAVRRARTRFARMLSTPASIFKVALAERADVYHLHDPELLPIGRTLHALGRRVVYDMHENTPKSILTKPWIPPRARPFVSRVYSRLERVLIGRAPVVFAEDSYARDYPWVRSHVTVLNLPMVEELFAVEVERYGEPHVAYIGGVGPSRGSLLTLQALGSLRRQGLNVGWECVGPIRPAHQDELEHLVRQHQLENIHFRGFLPSREGWPLVARCQIGLAVLSPEPNYVDSYPTKLFEYMALGMPVITANSPLVRSIVEEVGCGLCVDPRSSADLAAGIEWMVEHPAEASAMGERGRGAVIDRFRWSAEAPKLLDFYQRMTR
jgi:glycosyltransferase involved in cell wall biosynthesis